MVKSVAWLMVLIPSIAIAQGQPSITSVVFKPSSIAGGRPATATITLSGPAGSNGFEVGLSIASNVAQLASSAITIGSGQSSATVQVTTTPTAAAQLAVLTATARGETRTGNLTVLAPGVSTFSIAPAAVTAGQQATGTITLDGPAPAGGMAVTVSSNVNAVTLQSPVTVSAGQTSANISLSTSSVSSATTATLNAAAGGTSRSATLAINPAPITITSIGFPTSPKSRESVTLTAQASAPAPAGGLIVQFASSGANLFGGAATRVDTIFSGSTSLSRTFNVSGATTDRPFTLTATLNGVTTSRSGTLLSPRITSITLPDSVLSGATTTLMADLDAVVFETFPVVISTNNSAVTAPGSTSGFLLSSTRILYGLRTNPVVQKTAVSVTLTHLGVPRTKTIVVLPGPPILEQLSAARTVVSAGQSILLTVTLDRPAPRSGTSVPLSATGLPTGMIIPSSVIVPVGATSVSFAVQTPSRISSSVTVNVRATLESVVKLVGVRIDP